MAEIDLTKAKNLKAVSDVDPTISDVVKASKTSKKEKKGKFDFRESILVPLPSRGKIYREVCDDKDIIEDGHIRLLPMTVQEEEILSSNKYIKKGSVFRMILDRCIDSDIESKELLNMDAVFLMFYLRSISYGDNYEFTIKCSNETCGKKFNHSLDISKIEYKTLPEDYIEPFSVELPISKFTVEFMLPRLYHEEELVILQNKDMINTNSTRKDLVYRFYVSTINIYDEKGKEVPKEDWMEFYEALPGMDRSMLSEKINFSSNIDILKGMECPYCDNEFDMSIPIGAQFFRF